MLCILMFLAPLTLTAATSLCNFLSLHHSLQNSSNPSLHLQTRISSGVLSTLRNINHPLAAVLILKLWFTLFIYFGTLGKDHDISV